VQDQPGRALWLCDVHLESHGGVDAEGCRDILPMQAGPGRRLRRTCSKHDPRGGGPALQTQPVARKTDQVDMADGSAPTIMKDETRAPHVQVAGGVTIEKPLNSAEDHSSVRTLHIPPRLPGGDPQLLRAV